MSWKHPPPSKYKMVKNSTHQFTYSKYASNKFHQSNITNQNTRTAMYNGVNNFKAKYKLTSNKIERNINIPSNEVFCQRTISNKYPFALHKTVLGSENTSGKVPKMISETSDNVSSKSQALIREIESLTEKLKKTTENKSKGINTSGKDDQIAQDKIYNYKTSNENLKYFAFDKFKTVKNKNQFSKNNDITRKQFEIICSDIKPTVVLKKKLSSFNRANLISDNKIKPISSLALPNSLHLNKYSLKNIEKKKILSSKASCNPLKIVKNENKSEKNVQMFISESHLQNTACQVFKPVADNLSCDISNLDTKPLSLNSKLDTKLDITLEPALLGKKVSKYPDTVLKSRNMHKSTCVSKTNFVGSKYKRINVANSITPRKNLQLKNNSYLRPSSMKRTKGKLNTKFKIINKIVAPCAEKKAVLEKSRYGCKENSPLIVDKSDPLFKLLNDSTVDKLEHDLLALSTTLTATPISVKNDKGIHTKFNKMNPKLSHKKSFKKSKATVSKYKIVNSVGSHSYKVKNRHSFTNLRNIKKIKSKFSVVNKCLQPVHVTPVAQGKSVLIKRLFKSKNAIINKNVCSASHSAKLIKYKYFALNKRKLPYEKPVLYLKRPLSQPKFKGYLSPKLYAKKNRYQRSRNLAYSQGAMRRLAHYGCNAHASVFDRNVSCKSSKKKLHNGYGRSPVVFIRGLKYSLNSSGKTLRKLPVQDFTKTFQKTINNGKRYARISENKMKAATPISANLASRVLNRSITRVLSASSKKRLTKVNSYCMFYNRFGRCNRGVKCTYIHDPSKIAVCTRFLRGTCKIDGCPFSHEIAPGKMAICSFYLVGACDKDNCPYRHENLSSDAELCKAFVQGYCPNGKECKKAHILICPKYIQGSCEKGTSCAFPHPPQKVRKNVQNEIPDEENKQDDGLLEKVARYFQPKEDMSVSCENKSDDNNAANLFVPKQRKLEEQPSFIPLFDS